MASKSSEEDNLHYEREQSKDFRTTDSTNSNENKKDSELWKIAGEINAEHILTVGTMLGFPTAKIDHLKDVYPNQPQQRLYILLQKWREIVKKKYGHHRRLLAKLLSETGYKIISDNMNEDIRDIKIPIQLTTVLYDVCFDTVNPNEARSARPEKEELLHDYITTETCSSVPRKECMLKMLKDLELEALHPSKISLPMINEIIEKSTDEELTEKSIPWLILRKFMNLNYKGREADLSDLYKCHEDEHVDDFDDEKSEKNGSHLHPLDVFLLTFLCCDPILQQELVSKMFFCRLAVPFMYRTLEGKLIMSKWAFRKIVINRKKDDEFVEDDALSQFVQTVSFTRVGPRAQDTVSKSKMINMINEIISDQKLSIFFNKKDCISFETKKLITNGMVEASWLIPYNCSYSNQANISENVVMFLNLRGDSFNYDEEVKTVTSISDVIIVHIDVNILNESNVIQHLEKIHAFDKLIIYGIECTKGGIRNKAKIEYFKKQLKLKDDKTKFIKVEGEITRKLVEKFIRDIRKFLVNKKAKQFSEVISNIKFGDDNFSVEGYAMAKDIMDFIDKQPANDKCSLFPLQGSIWKNLCECTKELYRSKSEEEQDECRKIQNKIQQKQLELVEKSGALQQFARNMLSKGNDKKNNDENLFFIAWMKSLMDERLREIKKYKPKHFNFYLGPCYDHFIREMGQAFSIKDTLLRKITNTSEIEIFPSFASSMLQFGFPFELMDGDTGMVPLVWVEAVLRQLKRDIGDQNVYVISVLGIQSSGKSTLLNTMFGLHFAVSAGRCTRGVFMQLIKVTDPTLPFNYLLILDTEGIRAEKQRLVFENELATFVIGLGNITILNIKGENTSEIENFLQIAVYACLRLKMANENLKMEQRCVFVHQNVSAHDAHERLQYDRDILMGRLDQMVTDAAKSQDRSDINLFNQVIGIKPESDVWYFPDLWQGEPPMATVTLGYSEKVSRLKKHILYEIAKSHGTSYTISDTIIRINDFCKGILTDDFVFTFRNSLEIKVYREMDSRFQTLTWEPEWITDVMISTTISKNIARCTEYELESVCEMSSEKLRETLTQTFSLKEEEFRSFIDKNRLKNIMEQYTESRTFQLNELKQTLINKGQNEILRLKKRHQSCLHQMSIMKTHKRELKEKAQDLVSKCKTQALSEENMIKHFTGMWNDWLSGIESIKDERPLSVEKVIYKKLFEMFKGEAPLLQDQMRISNRDEYRTMKALDDTIGLDQIHDDHITSQLPIGIAQRKDVVLLKHKRHAFTTIKIIMQKIDSYIYSLQNEYRQFKESYATRVFRFLIEGLDTHNSNTSYSFSMTTKLRAKLAVHIKMYIVEAFTSLNKKWQEKNDIKTKIQSEKEIYLKDFISRVENQTTEMRMANMFINKIEQFITQTVSTCLPLEVVTRIYPDTFSTKYSLMVEIMTDLVRKSDFDEFMQYIKDSSVYALDWLTKYINKKMFSGNRHDNEYTQIAERRINIIFEGIKTCIDHATTCINEKGGRTKQKLYLWHTLFEERLNKTFVVTNGTFLTDIGEESVDVENYKKLIIDKFEDLKEAVKGRFKNQNADDVEWTDSPYIIVFHKLWGCIAKCPFCKESCQKKANHSKESHSCIQHRPPGVSGVRKKATQLMTRMHCNSLVYSNKTFWCGAFSLKCKLRKCDGNCIHKYKNYTELIPEWIIEPYPLNEQPKYWCWFISKFQKELCDTYNYKAFEHEDTWKNISPQDAIDSLKSNFELYKQL